MPNGIEVDSMVRRMSGGPMMLVLSVDSFGPGKIMSAHCAWYEGYRLECADILVDQLRRMTIIG